MHVPGEQNDALRALELVKSTLVNSALWFPNDLVRARLQAITLNNVACLYRNQGRLRKAYRMLQFIREFEKGFPRHADNATTHLNMGSVLSKLGKYVLGLFLLRVVLRPLTSDFAVLMEQAPLRFETY